MKKLKFLVLTDHSKHSSENSVYSIVSSLSKHGNVEEVIISSRGNKNNDSFFYNNSSTRLLGRNFDSNFTFDPSGDQFLLDQSSVELANFDCIFLRLPRPIETSFFEFLLNTAPNAVFINNPRGILKTSSKQFLLSIPDLCPPIKLCKSVTDVIDFAKHFPIVLKPLEDYGGRGIVKIDGNFAYEGNSKMLLNKYLEANESVLNSEGMLAMKFLKNVEQGDKRILVVNGTIMASSLRLPPEGSWMCNVAQGGKSIASEADADEVEIVKKVNPILNNFGVFIYGLDTLVDDNNKRVLSEINTLSIGGFPQAELQTGKPIIQQTINEIIEYVYKCKE